jgi:hypothetical protein
MMRIIPRSPDAYLFRDGGHTPVGWLKERTVRFIGFPSHRDAVAAAVQGGLALASYVGGTTLHTRHAGPEVARPPNDVGGEPAARDGRGGVRLVHDGRYEWVFMNARRVARLVPPADVEVVPAIDEVLACGGRCARSTTPEAGTFSIEFLFAGEVSLNACLTIAQVLYTAVQHHRIRPTSHTNAAPPSRVDSIAGR